MRGIGSGATSRVTVVLGLLATLGCDKSRADLKLAAAERAGPRLAADSPSAPTAVVSPADLTTNANADVLRVTVSLPGRPIDEELANRLLTRIRLGSWPAERVVAFRATAKRAPDAWRGAHMVHFELRPEAGLPTGWYTLSIHGSHEDGTERLPHVSSRFRIGSEPGIRAARICDRPGEDTGFDVIASLSEPISPLSTQGGKVLDERNRVLPQCQPVFSTAQAKGIGDESGDLGPEEPIPVPGLYELRYQCPGDFPTSSLGLEYPNLMGLDGTPFEATTIKLPAVATPSHDGECRRVAVGGFISLKEGGS